MVKTKQKKIVWLHMLTHTDKTADLHLILPKKTH